MQFQKKEKENLDLLKLLVSTILNTPSNHIESQKAYKTYANKYKGYHSLELDPNNVKKEYDNLYFKLEVHAFSGRAKQIELLRENCVRTCLDNLPIEDRLLAYSITYFLLECHQSFHKSNDVINTSLNVKEIEVDVEENWASILCESDDIKALIRTSYLDDEDYESDYEESIDLSMLDKHFGVTKHAEFKQPYVQSLPEKTWDLNSVEKICQKELQNEYWTDCKDLSEGLRQDKLNLPLLLKLEPYLIEQKPKLYAKHYQNRIELSEYQLVREILDVLQGSRQSTCFRTEYCEALIIKNRFIPSRKVKLLNLSVGIVDCLLKRLSNICSHLLQINLTHDFILHNWTHKASGGVSPSIVAFSCRLIVKYINRKFREFLVKLESRTRSRLGLTLLQLIDYLEQNWMVRIDCFVSLFICACSGRFEALLWDSSPIHLLNILYNKINDEQLCVTDKYLQNATRDLFFYSLKPYLWVMDGYLSATNNIGDFSHQDLFINTDMDNEKCLDFKENLLEYWREKFTIKNCNQIPLVFQSIGQLLVLTIKTIDLIWRLSEYLLKPSLLKPIVKLSGELLNQFNDKQQFSENSILIIDNFGKELDKMSVKRTLSKKIMFELADSLNIKCQYQSLNVTDEDNCYNVNSFNVLNQQEDPCQEPIIEDALEEGGFQEIDCVQLDVRLKSYIVKRYNEIMDYAIYDVFVGEFQLERQLGWLHSIYFCNAGVEMWEFHRYFYEILAQQHHVYNIRDIQLLLNMKLDEVLSESVLDLPEKRFSVGFQGLSLDNSEELLGLSRKDYLMKLVDCIELKYQNDWFMQLIMTSELFEQCNKCFRFLLMLRVGKISLEWKLPRHFHGNSLSRQTVALKVKLLQLINSLHYYVMNSFIVPCWEEIYEHLHRSSNHHPSASGEHHPGFQWFVDCILERFQVMLRGCLQSTEMLKVFNAIRDIVCIAVELTQIYFEIETQQITLHVMQDLIKQRLNDIQKRYEKVMGFVTVLFRSLKQSGLTINGLDFDTTFCI